MIESFRLSFIFNSVMVVIDCAYPGCDFKS